MVMVLRLIVKILQLFVMFSLEIKEFRSMLTQDFLQPRFIMCRTVKLAALLLLELMTLSLLCLL